MPLLWTDPHLSMAIPSLWSQGEPTGKDLCDQWEKTACFSILSDVEPNFAVLRKNPKTFKEAEQEAKGSWEEGKQKAGGL